MKKHSSNGLRTRLGFHLSPLAALAFAAWAMAGCSSDDDTKAAPEGPLPDAGDVYVEGSMTLESHHPDLPPFEGFDRCTVELGHATAVDPTHHPECTPIHYSYHPPTIGPHYPVWAAWRSYRGPIPSAYLVHNLEHGGIVLLYNCANGCPDLLESLETLIDELPDDPKCAPPVRHRFVLAEDPELDVPLAAVAWGHWYKATCLDLEGLRAFIDEHYAKGREDSCKDGFDFTSQEGGTITVCADGKGGTGSEGMSQP